MALGDEYLAELSARDAANALDAQVQKIEECEAELRNFYFPDGLIDAQTLKDIDGEVRTFVREN